MKLLLVITFIIVLLALVGGSYFKHRIDNIVDKRNLRDSIDSEVDKFSKNGLHDSLVLGVYKNGVTFFKGYGKSNPDSSTIFQIASVSKLFTSSLLVILCEEGVLEMESTLEELIGDKYVLSPEAKQVTVYQLATHTSGFPKVPRVLMDIVENKVGKDNLLDNPYSHIELDDVINYLANPEGKQKPGKFEYSNYGMGLLGHILEIVTQKSLETLAKEKLFLNLNMMETSIKLTPEMKQRLAQGYTANGEEAQLWTANALGGAGAFNSSASDLMKFVIANIDGRTGLSSVFESMQKASDNGRSIGWMRPGFIERFFGNKTTIWHNGMVGGYASYMALDLQSNSGVVVLSNKAVDLTILGIMLVRQARTQSW